MIDNEQAASAIHAIIFGFFCLIVMISGVVYIAVMNNQASLTPVQDTYGNTFSNVTNGSQTLVQNTAVEGDPGLVWLILIAAAVTFSSLIVIMLVISKSVIST